MSKKPPAPAPTTEKAPSASPVVSSLHIMEPVRPSEQKKTALFKSPLTVKMSVEAPLEPAQPTAKPDRSAATIRTQIMDANHQRRRSRRPPSIGSMDPSRKA